MAIMHFSSPGQVLEQWNQTVTTLFPTERCKQKISTIEPMYRGYAGILANQLNESQTQVIRKPEMYWQDSSKVCQLKLTL